MTIKESKRSLGNLKQGFTLIEMMLVIALIVLLVGVAVFNARSIFGQNQSALTKVKIDAFKTPLFNYRMNLGSYPTTDEGLKALLYRPASDRGGKWKGPYIESKENLIDPWQMELKYRFPGTKNPGGYDLYSLGPDKVESEDDIGNWE